MSKKIKIQIKNYWTGNVLKLIDMVDPPKKKTAKAKKA